MADDQRREVRLTRTGPHRLRATNRRGATLDIGDGSDDDFTPIELLLAASAACAGLDVEAITRRLAAPEQMDLLAFGDKVRDEHGNHLASVEVTFRVRFPEGEGGDAARERLPDAVARSRDWLCSVSRTVALPTPVVFHLE
jgi:putative redox protein